MTHKEIESYRAEKADILKKNQDVQKKLIELAEKVGASTVNRDIGHGKATIPQLAEHIDNCLHTASMIYMCKIAAHRFLITVLAAAAAIVSALAAWAAIIKSAQ